MSKKYVGVDDMIIENGFFGESEKEEDRKSYSDMEYSDDTKPTNAPEGYKPAKEEEEKFRNTIIG